MVSVSFGMVMVIAKSFRKLAKARVSVITESSGGTAPYGLVLGLGIELGLGFGLGLVLGLALDLSLGLGLGLGLVFPARKRCVSIRSTHRHPGSGAFGPSFQ